MAEPIKEEKEIKRSATQVIYEFIDSEKEIKVISK
jgi:hypothetical protein